MGDIRTIEEQLHDRIGEIVVNGDHLARAITEVIFEGRRAEQKLWIEYRRVNLSDDIYPHDSWAEGEALHDALDNLEKLLGWEPTTERLA